MGRAVLIIEDNAITRKMLRLALEGEQYKVWEADNAQEGLRVTQAQRPDLIMQDLMLPDMDGYDLIKRLRALPAAAAIPVLCYSGLIGADERDTALAAGFTDVVLKPAAPVELLKVIRSYLNNQHTGLTSTFSGRHILVVDDDPVLRKLSALRLRASGARVTTAEDGKDALSKARAETPDAILSDVLMPECDGFGLCQALRHDPALASIPVVLMSSQYVEKEDLALAQQLGATSLVTRSADLGAALSALAESLTAPAPAPAASSEQLQALRVERVMHRVHRQISEQAHTVQTQNLYSILTGFLEQVADLQAHGGELAAKLDEVLTHYLDTCGYPTGAIYLYEAGDELAPHALCGVRKAKAEAWLDFFGQLAVLRQAMERDAPTVLSMDDLTAHVILQAAAAQTIVLCPLQIARKPLGILVLCSKRRSVDPEWLALVQATANPISQAIGFARALTALKASEQRFRNIAESLADGIVIADEQGLILYINAAVERLFGYSLEHLRGKNCAEVLPLLAAHAGIWAGSLNHQDGHPVAVSGSTAAMHDPDHPERLIYTHVIHDLSAQEHLEQLRHLANHDPLTQIANRRCFEEALKVRLGEVERYGVHGAVLVLDLDYFKPINDRLGHAAGDAALIKFTRIITHAIRETDLLARTGGDEFAILAPYADAADAQELAGKLLTQLAAQALLYNGETIRLSASIGIAIYSKSLYSPEALLASADRALYEAKQAGRGCYQIDHGEIQNVVTGQ